MAKKNRLNNTFSSASSQLSQNYATRRGFMFHSVHQVCRVWCVSEHSLCYSEGWQYHLVSPILPLTEERKAIQATHTKNWTEYGRVISQKKTLLSQEGATLKAS